MRTRQFEVPVEIMYEFAKVLCEHEVRNWIEAVGEDGEDKERGV